MNDFDGYMKFKPYTDRLPKDTSKEISDRIDEEFNEKFGWLPRSSGVFTTSSKINAGFRYSRYKSEPYIFFPRGDYEYLYNTEIEDLYIYFSDANVNSYEQYEKNYSYAVSGYEYENLSNAIHSSVEIMFKCKSYYLVKYEYKDELIKRIYF